jgi:hypothetical protein
VRFSSWHKYHMKLLRFCPVLNVRTRIKKKQKQRFLLANCKWREYNDAVSGVLLRKRFANNSAQIFNINFLDQDINKNKTRNNVSKWHLAISKYFKLPCKLLN